MLLCTIQMAMYGNLIMKTSLKQIWVQLLATLDKLLTLLEQHREVHFNEGMPEEEENLEVRQFS